MDQVTATIPNGATPGTIALSADWPDHPGAVNNGQVSLNLIPVISSVSQDSAPVGGVVVIQGSTFASESAQDWAPGASWYVSFGGVKATTYYLWSDSAIEVAVPSGAVSGKLNVVTGYGQTVTWGQAFTVAAASGSSSSGGSSAGSTFGGSSGSNYSNYKPNYGFLPLPAAPNPIQLHIIASTSRAKPGASIDLTATLQLNGKPIAGAPVTFQITDSPGSDAQLSAAKGVTDPAGNVHVSLLTSKKPGETVVVATSGAFSDQLRVLTYSPAAATSGLPRTLITRSTLDPHVLVPFIGALILAVMLLLGAVVLQWRLHRRALMPAPVAAVEAVAAPVEPAPKRPRRPRAPKVAPPSEVQRVEEPASETAAAVEPAELAQAVGAEDLVAADVPHDAIAPVIPLRKPRAARAVQNAQARRRAPEDGGTISRTRGRTKTDR